ncbi:MAG: hypothetical protein IKW92_08200 [Firmicutes bacterium]|nr:hypothetical protein [Bacillota bacterium]
MKKICAVLLALAMVFALAACSSGPAPEPEPEPPDYSAKSEGVMTYEQYVSVPVDGEVTVEGYVQAAQSWWDNQVSVYLQDLDGAYYVENMLCTEEDADALTPGRKIKVTGKKTEEYGEVKITAAAFEFGDELEYIAPPIDVTAILDTDEMIKYQNRYVLFSDMEVVSEALYNWAGDGSHGDDLYFQVGKDGQVFTFMVESDLTGSGTDVYEAVTKLKKGDIVDLEGFCCWFDGLTPHITGVTVK